MRKYESVVILKPGMEEEARKAMVEQLSNLITDQGATIESTDEWGNRRLAYPIQDFTEGYYILFTFNAEAEVPMELERVYKITDAVLRYMVVKVEE
jgi:small subunit ribosomal protein S6